MIHIIDDLTIDDGELVTTASPSSGPGGQNVNKVATRITLRFDVDASPSLSAEAKALIKERLATRISKDGVLRVVSQRHRTQKGNREAALERFVELLRDALEVDPERRPTKVPRGVHRRRLEGKRHRSRVKADRGRNWHGSE